jgi:hypothetical protein
MFGSMRAKPAAIEMTNEGTHRGDLDKAPGCPAATTMMPTSMAAAARIEIEEWMENVFMMWREVR